MLAYLLIFIVVWISAYAEFVFYKKHKLFLVSYLISFVFVATRYHTGYDWTLYERLFLDVESVDEISIFEAVWLSIHHEMELMFVFINSATKYFINDYIAVQIVSAGILYFGSYVFLKKYSENRAFVFAVVFTWLMFSLYFSTVRQAIAVGAFYLFWINWENKHKIRALLCMVLAIGVQHSSMIYFLLFFMAINNFVFKMRWLLFASAILLIILAVVGVDLIVLGAQYLPLGGGVLESKLNWYLYQRPVDGDMVGLLFVIAYTLAIGIVLLVWSNYKYQHLDRQRIYNFAILFLPIQALFLNYSVFRNRLLYVAMTISLVVVADYFARQTTLIRLIVVTCALMLLSTYYILFLTSAAGKPFVPYNNYILTYAFSSRDDGENRLIEYISNHAK